jgi:hypothetical protein
MTATRGDPMPLPDPAVAVNALHSRVAGPLWSTLWRRRVTSIALVFTVQAGVLGIRYRAVIFQGRTLLTGCTVLGTEGMSPQMGTLPQHSRCRTS